MFAVRMRNAFALISLATALSLAMAVPSAGAKTRWHDGLHGLLPARGSVGYGHIVNRAGTRAAAPDLSGNLDYHGGLLMHSNATYAIYWDPSGSFPSDYRPTIDRYFRDVATDSGGSQNVFGLDPQYTDNYGGNAAYQSSFGGSVVDTNAFPASGCTDPTGQTSVCLSDGQLSSEIDRVITAQGWPRGMGAIYFIFTPKEVSSCADATLCTFLINNSAFCGYHSSFDFGSGTTIYANEPWTAHPDCDVGEHPNSDSADSTISIISHELSEAVTDPVDGSGWWDNFDGSEIGDKCAWDFGDQLGGGVGSLFNQIINGDQYWMQQEWSNSDTNCEQRPTAQSPTASFVASPQPAETGQAISFDASGSSSPNGPIGSYQWDFGDGSTAGGATVSHSYTDPGSPQVTLSVTDPSGRVASVTQTLTVTAPQDKPPVASFTAGPAVAGTPVSFDGSGSSDPDGQVVSYAWDFGDGSHASGPRPQHTYAQPGIPTVTLTVTDNSGSTDQTSQQIAVGAPPPPPLTPPTAAFIVSPPAAQVGTPIVFNGSLSSAPGGQIAAYQWDFGDGTQGTGQTAMHAYASTGTYTASLVVIDSHGVSDATTRTVAISSGGNPPVVHTSSFHGVTVRAAKLRVSRGVLLLPLACPVPTFGGCNGRLTLDQAGHAVGRATFWFSAGKGGRVRVRLSSRARRLLARHRHLRVTLVVVAADADGNRARTKRSLTLRVR
jgi:PKD repeat protein